MASENEKSHADLDEQTITADGSLQQKKGGKKDDQAYHELQSQCDTLQTKNDELNNQYLRLAADFENFRKRTGQEREALLKYGAHSTLERLLPVLDNLERAQETLTVNSDPEMLYKSFEMMFQQLLGSLHDVGLRKMSPQGEPFNPEHHEAISQVDNASVPDGTIVEVYKDGYMLHDRVLRPAQVVVATHPAGEQPSSQDSGRSNPFSQSVTNPGETHT